MKFMNWKKLLYAQLFISIIPTTLPEIANAETTQTKQSNTIQTKKGKTEQTGISKNSSNSLSKIEIEFSKWIKKYEEKYKPLAKASNIAYWVATASGKEEDYQKSADTELALRKLHTNKRDFLYLKTLKKIGIKDPSLARQLDLVYLSYLQNQFNPELLKKIVNLSSKIGENFNIYRAKVGGKVLSDNDVEEILNTSKDSNELKNVWSASKDIGKVVSKDLINLVKLRNTAAKQLGYKDYFNFQLAVYEMDEKELFKILKEVAEKTEEPFKKVKAEIDQTLAKSYNIPVSDLMPWHYHNRFFQEAPSTQNIDLDTFYKGKSILELSRQFYQDLNLPADEVYKRSDLEERPGKYQHAYCTDIDREGDVRIMESAKDNAKWMDTTLHETGHAVYSLAHTTDTSLPFLLRDAAHSFTTEGYANMIGRLGGNPYWMKKYAGLSNEQLQDLAPKLKKQTINNTLVFMRWGLTITHFEKELYKNPDQDLNSLWWKLVQKYQLLVPPANRNAPDWASKIHVVTHPAYYQNYVLGELFAAQLHNKIVNEFYQTNNQSQAQSHQDPWSVYYSDKKEVGAYLKDNVLKSGATWKWDKFVEMSTGKKLAVDDFVAQYAP